MEEVWDSHVMEGKMPLCGCKSWTTRPPPSKEREKKKTGSNKALSRSCRLSERERASFHLASSYVQVGPTTVTDPEHLREESSDGERVT